jgi:hypothetical protein
MNKNFNNFTVCVVTCSCVYLSLFFTSTYLGGVTEMRAFLGSSVALLTNIGSGFQQTIFKFGSEFRQLIADFPMTTASAIVTLINGIAVNVSLTTFCVITVLTSTIAGLVFDKQLVFDVTTSMYSPFAEATLAIWKIISKPSNLVSYGIFYLLVTVFPQLLDAIRAVASNGQKL